MSTIRARSILAERSHSAGTILLAILLELSVIPDWAHGTDQEGRAIVLVGRRRLEQREETGAEFVQVVLEAMKAGEVPNGVHVVSYAPKASQFIATVVDGNLKEVVGVGPRESGKSQGAPGALASLAEFHDAAGFPLPLRSLCINESLVSFSMKMGRSLEEEHWGGCWKLRNDRREAVLTLAGVEYVLIDAVGAYDESAAERLKTRCHVVNAEELTPSLNDTKGIEEDKYTLGVSSISLPTPNPVAMATCNPAGPSHWVYKRFVSPGLPGCTAVTVPASDRLSPQRIEELKRAFQHNPEQCQRLVEGQWVDLPMGAMVAEGFNERIHVAPYPLRPNPQFYFGIGWDGGHSPSAVMGQNQGGQIQVFAALNDLRVGVLELIERQVLPWMQTYAPWALSHYGAHLVHLIDLNMATPGQATIMESAEKIIVRKLGGTIIKSAVRWPPRREAILRALAPRHEGGRPPLLISPGPETDLLVQAFSTKWFYPTSPGGQVDRTGPKKPNSPWADVGDAAAYLFDWLLGSEPMQVQQREVKVITQFEIGQRYGDVKVESEW
jgi:hypothetical protein